MATFKSNMAQAADDMLDLPANLEGILQEVNGQKEVKPLHQLTMNWREKKKPHHQRKKKSRLSSLEKSARQSRLVVRGRLPLKAMTFGHSSCLCVRMNNRLLWKLAETALPEWYVWRKTFSRHFACVP